MADHPNYERDLIAGLDTKGDGHGLGSTLAPHIERRSQAQSPSYNDETPDSTEATGEGAPEHDPRDRDVFDVDHGENEQHGARLSHARAQSGDMRACPDPTRAQGRLGSINDTEGL